MSPVRCLAVVLVCALTTLTCAAQKIERLELVFGGKKRTVHYFAPGGDKPLPLVILLHGSNRNGRIMVDEWKALAMKEQVVIAGPDAIRPETWLVDQDGTGFMHEVVEAVNAKRALDPTRTYLFGHSSGAEFALILGLLESEYFAAVAVHAGGLHAENANVFQYAKRKVPVGIWIGDRDPLVPLRPIEETRDMFKTRGFPVSLNVMRGHDHNYYVVSGEVNKEVWAFFKETALEAPFYQEYLKPSPPGGPARR